MSRILVVDDDPEMGQELKRVLGRAGHESILYQRADEAFDRVMVEDFDAVLTDLRMHGMSGVELCDRIVQNRPDVPVIVVTGFGDLQTAIATLRAGASDFLVKPFDAEQLLLAVERAHTRRALEQEVRRLRHNLAHVAPSELLGNSTGMMALNDVIGRVASTDATVLVTGESGVGKELVARAIHRASARRDGPLVALNCAAMPEALLESELFGHVRGAFTDAKTARRGLFVEASGGTLLLDEIGEMPLAVQAKLLRALEGRRVRPVGASAEIAFDVRLLASTNRDLETMVAARAFREDLFYRVNVIHLEVPPLRARENDVLLLALQFVERLAKKHEKRVSGFGPAVAEKLMSYRWPGNVRELHNSLERAVAMTRFEQITVEDLPPKIRTYKPDTLVLGGSADDELMTLETLERRYIARVLDIVGHNKVHATRILGIDRSTLYRKLERYGIAADG